MRKLVLVFACVAFAALIGLRFWAVPSVPPKPITNVVTTTNREKLDESSADKSNSLERPMIFSSDGLAGRVLRTAEGVAGSGNAKVSVSTQGQARLICILIAGMKRNYSLDEGLEPGQFTFIQSQKFTPPDPHVLQTMSIFRSLAKKEIGFSAQQGDWIIVLACPKEEWASLQLQWPAKVTNDR